MSIVDHFLLSALSLLKSYILQTFPHLLAQDSITEGPGLWLHVLAQEDRAWRSLSYMLTIETWPDLMSTIS